MGYLKQLIRTIQFCKIKKGRKKKYSSVPARRYRGRTWINADRYH